VSLDYRENPQRIHRYFSLLITLALLIRVPLFAFTVGYHREIVEVLFGGRFIDYSYLLSVVALFTLGAVIGNPVTLVAQLEEKAQFVLASKIFGLYGVAASLLLIPVFGVLGAVIASGTAILFKNLFIWWFVRKLAHWQNAAQFLLRRRSHMDDIRSSCGSCGSGSETAILELVTGLLVHGILPSRCAAIGRGERIVGTSFQAPSVSCFGCSG
jgi:O-antigen/teichoic acid export membrane protein